MLCDILLEEKQPSGMMSYCHIDDLLVVLVIPVLPVDYCQILLNLLTWYREEVPLFPLPMIRKPGLQ